MLASSDIQVTIFVVMTAGTIIANTKTFSYNLDYSVSNAKSQISSDTSIPHDPSLQVDIVQSHSLFLLVSLLIFDSSS